MPFVSKSNGETWDFNEINDNDTNVLDLANHIDNMTQDKLSYLYGPQGGKLRGILQGTLRALNDAFNLNQSSKKNGGKKSRSLRKRRPVRRSTLKRRSSRHLSLQRRTNRRRRRSN